LKCCRRLVGRLVGGNLDLLLPGKEKVLGLILMTRYISCQFVRKFFLIKISIFLIIKIIDAAAFVDKEDRTDELSNPQANDRSETLFIHETEACREPIWAF